MNTFYSSQELTGVAKQLLILLKGVAPEWQDRRQLGKLLGRKLSNTELFNLRYLQREQLIETRHSKRKSGMIIWEYRAK